MVKTKVALVDDHALVRDGFAKIVNNFTQFTVMSQSENGKHFIDGLQELDMPQIVLLDITMPIMNGFETAAWLKKNHPKILIIALSMLADDDSIIKMLRNGANGYLLKNTHPAELENALNTVLEYGYYANELTSNKSVTGKENNYLGDNHLSEREVEFIKLLSQEKTNKEIADLLFVSIRTLEYYRDTIYLKTNTKSKIGMIMFALKNGLI